MVKWLRRLFDSQEIAGSIPARCTVVWCNGSAADSRSEGCRFESGHGHPTNSNFSSWCNGNIDGYEPSAPGSIPGEEVGIGPSGDGRGLQILL